MSLHRLVELEILRFDWNLFHCGCDDPSHLPNDLIGMIGSSTRDDLKAHGLENHIAPNALLYEAAVPVVSVMMAALAMELPPLTRSFIMDHLWRISGGEPAAEALERGSVDIHLQCQSLMREGVWHFYEFLASGDSDDAEIAYGILARIEYERGRVAYYRKVFGDKIPDDPDDDGDR